MGRLGRYRLGQSLSFWRLAAEPWDAARREGYLFASSCSASVETSCRLVTVTGPPVPTASARHGRSRMERTCPAPAVQDGVRSGGSPRLRGRTLCRRSSSWPGMSLMEHQQACLEMFDQAAGEKRLKAGRDRQAITGHGLISRDRRGRPTMIRLWDAKRRTCTRQPSERGVRPVAGSRYPTLLWSLPPKRVARGSSCRAGHRSPPTTS